MKLTAENYGTYLNQVYSAWLGKIIGIRLGAPIEGWSYSQILEKYPEITDYVCDYGIFAADDDSNGPLFFVRALLDNNDITREDIGNTFLNYIQEYSGFFWWGGVGISTEHTAYENLKNGIKAPLSGAIETNGVATAEQIGGQIFSDCWGYVAGYDPYLAVDLARKAASVTHDGNGLEGAAFVAAAIVYAYTVKDIHQVIELALGHLNSEMEYYRVCRDIIRFYSENHDDWHKCLQYIFDNYGYDKYPGTCHIIPNSALMIMAMCYGEGDFSKTMCMLVQSGWDTDCTAGNVGSIMGALVGIEGIDPKWITPINDVLNASSCVGCLNIQTVFQSAAMFAKLAMKLQGLKAPQYRHFSLPYATEGFFSDGQMTVRNHSLISKGTKLYKYSYYLGDDVYDARYDPVYSPTVYPGDVIRFSVEGKARIFIEDCVGKIYCGQEGSGDIKFIVPTGINLTVHKYGLIYQGSITVRDYRIIPSAHIEHDFTCYTYDTYGPRYRGDDLVNIRGYVPHSGNWQLDNNGLRGNCDDHGFITTGSLGMLVRKLDTEFEIMNDGVFSLVFDAQGYMHYSALEIGNDTVTLIRKDDAVSVIDRKTVRHADGLNKLSIKLSDNGIFCLLNEQEFSFDKPLERKRGIAGFRGEHADILIKNLKIRT